jgi:hypothetical protein
MNGGVLIFIYYQTNIILEKNSFSSPLLALRVEPSTLSLPLPFFHSSSTPGQWKDGVGGRALLYIVAVGEHYQWATRGAPAWLSMEDGWGLGRI